MTETCDFLVIGSGVIGMSIAIKLSDNYPCTKIILIDKETGSGQHASGRNSGVLHAGFYYTADSLKARFTRDGNQAWHNFCQEYSIPVNNCGKLVVARNEAEDKVIDLLMERGQSNGIKLEIIDSNEAKRIEPRVKTHNRALYSPTTSTVDPEQIMENLTSEARKKGVVLKLNCAYRSVKEKVVNTSTGDISAGYVVNCAGLFADSIAHDFDFGHQYYLLPFKGVYLYSSVSAPKIATNIYPVPDLKNPFLGVHFTVTASGSMKLGPSAIPALWPEQYNWHSNFKFSEFIQTSGNHMKLLFGGDNTFRKLALEEIKKYSGNYLVEQAKHLAYGFNSRHFDHWGKPGIRAQLINRQTKKLEMDFIVESDEYSLHVLNAVSPGFTCALSFAEYLVKKINS